MSFRLFGTTGGGLLPAAATRLIRTTKSSYIYTSSWLAHHDVSFSSTSTSMSTSTTLLAAKSALGTCSNNNHVITAGAGGGGSEGRGREITGFIATLLLLATASTSSLPSSLNLLSSLATADGGGGDRQKDDDDERTKSSSLDSHSSFVSRRLLLMGDYLVNKLTTTTTTTTSMNTTMCEEALVKNKNNHQNDDTNNDDEGGGGHEIIKTIVDPKELKEQQQRHNENDNKYNYYRRRMTNVGRFSLVSETVRNPSVPVLVLAMTGKPWKSDDFRRLYQQRNVAEKHPRFAARLDSTKTHFVFDNHNHNNDNGKNNDNYRNRKRRKVVDNVRDVLFPSIPIAELKDRINDAALYEPLDLNTRLWEAWTATGGSIGQSGAITSTSIQQQQNDNDNNDVESLLLFRAHHCMADGVSLGALFGDLMDEGPKIQEEIKQKIQLFKQKKKRTPWWKKILFVLQYWMWGTLKAFTYQLYLFAVTWYDRWVSPHDDPWMILKSMYDDKKQHTQRSSSQQQQQLPPRSLSWATVAPVDEVKKVADYYSRQWQQQQQQQQENVGKRSSSSRITINDVFCSCVSAAIIKQLKYHRSVNPKISSSSPSPNANMSTDTNAYANNKQSLQHLSLPYMNLIIPVHLQGGILLPGQSMGNKIGAMVSRIPGENLTNDDPALLAQERLIQVHTVLNERKQTPIAVLSYTMAGFMGYLSPSSSTSTSTSNDTSSVGSSSSSWTPWFFSKAHANASVVVTNTRGPESCVHLEGRPIRALLGFLPLPAGVPVGVVVGSYNNEITLTVTAEEYAVPDADKFLGWVEDEYELLKCRAATGTADTEQ